MAKKKLKNCPECGMKVVSLYSDHCKYCDYEFLSRCEKCHQLISVFKNKHICIPVKLKNRKKSKRSLLIAWKYPVKPKKITCSYCNEELETGKIVCSYCGHSLEQDLEVEMAEMEKERRCRAITKQVQREVWRRDMGRCVECGSKERLEYDHIIPFSRGGSNTVRNIQLLCEKCNREKYNRIGG